LPALRSNGFAAAGDVEEYAGREVKPQDNGYLSGKHGEFASQAEKNRLMEFPGLEGSRDARPGESRKKLSRSWPTPVPASSRPNEFIAIREN